MALLLLDRAQLEVKTEGDSLALYEAGQRRGTVPIALIERCIVHGGNTRLDSGMLLKLAEAGAVTVFMSPRRQQRTALVLGPRHNDAAIRLAQAQRVLDLPWCQSWALPLVLAKLARQQRSLEHLRAQRPDARKPLFDALNSIAKHQHALHRLQSDSPNSNLASLRGHEGAAARAYFAGLGAVFAPALGFSGRNRRPPRDPVNACLSLGYTLLHLQAVHACTSAGLDPLLGFYHRPAIGRESLASDLIEPLRASVDLWVWQRFKEQQLRADHFSHDHGACLLGKAGRSIFYQAWEQHHKPWQRWLRQHCQQLARQLRAQGLVWLDPGTQGPEHCDETC